MRLIDGDEIEELFHEVISGIAKKQEMTGNLEHMVRASAMVIEMLHDAPTVDAVPVVHGRWIMAEGELAFWDACSECGKKILHRILYYDFCPNCGADMRKDGDDGKAD